MSPWVSSIPTEETSLRHLPLVLLTMLAAVALAACGDTAAGDDAATGQSARDKQEEARVQLQACLRKEGVDIGERPAQGGRPSGLDESKMREAMEGPCRKYREQAFGNVSEADRQEMRDRMVKFASCMREHGVDIPDPGGGSQSGGAHRPRRPEGARGDGGLPGPDAERRSRRRRLHRTGRAARRRVKLPRPGRRRLLAGGALALVAGAIAAMAAGAVPGGSGEESRQAASISTATTEIRRQDLVEVETEDGTLGHGDSREVDEPAVRDGYVAAGGGRGREAGRAAVRSRRRAGDPDERPRAGVPRAELAVSDGRRRGGCWSGT